MNLYFILYELCAQSFLVVKKELRRSLRSSELSSLQPDYPPALNSLGLILWQEGNRDRALEDLDKAIAFPPDYAEAHYNWGVAGLRAGDVQRGAQGLREAVALKPDYLLALALQKRWGYHSSSAARDLERDFHHQRIARHNSMFNPSKECNSDSGEEWRKMKRTRNYFQFLLVLLMAAGGLTGSSLAAQEDFFVNADMPWHKAVLDAQGRLLAWYHPEKNLGYDKFMRLDWDFLEHKVPVEKQSGVKVYLVAPTYDPLTLQGLSWQHNPAGTYAHLMDMLVGWYPYSGDEDSIPVMREMLDYQLAHGTTPTDWEWANVPFATSCLDDKEYGRCIQDMPREFYGGIETDKIGELGLGYVLFYELTGERKYLDAGIHCADQLAKHIRPGDATHTPWPFRVDAHTGTPIDEEEYGGMIVGPVRLFDELLKLGEGDAASFKKARDMAWKWLMGNPLNKASAAWDKWSGYYEDVPKDIVNVNDMTSIVTAYYIISHEDPSVVDPEWKHHVGHLIDRSRVLLGRGPFFGAWAIDEQLRPDGGITGASSVDTEYLPHGSALLGVDNRGCCSRAGLVCRTSQWGAINAMYYEKTGDGTARENAFRSLNYATYFAKSDGEIACCGEGTGGMFWFEDGHADAGRSFMWALGAMPEFAPIGQDHLLRSSSVIQKVQYGNRTVEYRTFEKSGTEVFRLSFKPVHVMAGGAALTEREDLKEDGYTIQTLSHGDYEVRLRHLRSNQISIKGD